MNARTWTSLERVLAALSHQEPDRVPLFLLVNTHGAKHLGVSIRDYLSSAEHMAEGQLLMQRRYSNDCLYGFSYASVEAEAFGGETIFFEDGPPNAGAPVIRSPSDILELSVPAVEELPCLRKVLDAQAMMKREAGDTVPIIGVVMSPFSLPVMQLGFEAYLEVMLKEPALFDHLMSVNEQFTVDWANAQLKAGATAITYYDPVSSPTIITPDQYRRTGFEIARRALEKIEGPTAVHLASGRSLTIIEDLKATGTQVLGVSVDEDLGELKLACKGQVAILGNLNGIEMCRWTKEQVEKEVKNCIRKAGPGGGFVLADNHGEIPFQVPDEVLLNIAQAVNEWGRYPLDWTDEPG